ncbi:MAG: class II aldolase/adducin family protein [Deltaproteobacteria bacterium]|nr:class II aldolase/adducin family protein [Deltaproteobacteria bacterium]
MALMMSLEGFRGAAQNAEAAVLDCVLANRILSNEEILDAFGHVSVRNPENKDTFFQSRSLAPGLVTQNDILEIDLEGNVITKTEMKPYGERIIHAAILKARPDVNAVFHGHPHSIIPFSSTGIPIKPIAHFSAMFYQGVPLFDDYDVSSGMLIATPEEGERVARTLGDARAVLLRDHGCCVVGDSIQTMVMASIYLRDNAALQYQALQLGEPKYLSYEEGEQATRISESALAVERAWGYWVNRAKKAMPDLP